MTRRTDRIRPRGIAAGVLSVALLNISLIIAPPSARADALGYLINVTVRPGYNFANADAALAYGNNICDRVGEGISYSQNLATVKTDLGTDDDYQGAYLINQAVEELCPALIWQLRQSVRS